MIIIDNQAKQLIERLGTDIDFFKLFYQCDNATGDKKSDDKEINFDFSIFYCKNLIFQYN